MFFYTDVAGIGLGAIGLIMLVARVVDAVTDPMMGVIIDKTHTRWGEGKAVCTLDERFPSESSAHPCSWYRISGTGKFIYALITYILFCIVYTASIFPTAPCCPV